MKTTVITAALLTILFAGCSKEETVEPQSLSNTSAGQLTKSDISGLYSVKGFTREGNNYLDEMKDLKVYIYRDNSVVRTVVKSETSKGEYKYDTQAKILSFSIVGNAETTVLASKDWQVRRPDGMTLDLFADDGKVNLILTKHNPLVAEPVLAR